MLKQQRDLMPVIFITGKEPEHVVTDALHNGAIYTLQKGGNPNACLAELFHKCHLAVQQRGSEIALKECGEKYWSEFGHAPEGILLLDLQGTILLANNAAVKIFEADSSASLTGRNVLEFITPESRETLLADFLGLAQGNETCVAEYEGVTVQGKSIQLESTGRMISYESKPAILLSIRVITHKKIAEKELCRNETLCRTLIKTADYGVFIINGDRILYANPYFTAMTGYSPDELQNIRVWDLIHTDFCEDFKERVSGRQKAGKHTHDHVEVILIAKGGTECQVRLGITPVEFDEKPAILGTARDVTDQRSAENRLEQVNKKLHLLNEVTHHDLLNNFTALFGYFEIIRQNTLDPDNLEYIKKQEIILSAIHEQINFTGYYQNIGNLKPQWQYVEKIIREAASTLSLEQVVLNPDLGKTEILADPLLIRVFYNLMENSLRHGEHVTEIRYLCEKRPDGLAIIYQDNGIGIPAKNKERIFVKGMGRNSGLGLFLIKEILAITKMTICENGEPGKGARFEVLVPEGKYR
jgi:PAS domain S-box-containing protein